MRRILLNSTQLVALGKIASRSGMGDWFSFEVGNGGLFAREVDINTLFDGATEYDIASLSTEEVLSLFNLLLKCNKIKAYEKSIDRKEISS